MLFPWTDPPSERRIGQWARRLVAAALLFAPMSHADAPPARPVLAHNLPVDRSGASDSLTGLWTALRSDFTLEPLALVVSESRLAQSPALVFWVTPALAAAAPAKASSLAPKEIARLLLHHVELGSGLLIVTGPGQADLNSAEAVTTGILAELGMVQGRRTTGPKVLTLRSQLPLIGGMTWTSAGFAPLDSEEASSLTQRVVIPNDLSQATTPPGSPDFAGQLMIWGQYGKGRVVIIAAGLLDLGTVLPGHADATAAHENLAILQRLATWAAGR